MKLMLLPPLSRCRASIAAAAGVLILSASQTLSLRATDGDEDLLLGNPPVLDHPTPNGVTETAQRLIPFPFTPPDVKLKENEALSSSDDWFTKHDKNKIDELGGLDFYVSSGLQSVGIVPKLHNTSAGVEIYELTPPLTKETFERKEGPYRAGITKKYSNVRSGEKVAKFKAGALGESGLACFYMSRLLGHVVEVPPATYRTMDVQELAKLGAQAVNTGNPSCSEAWAVLRAQARSGNPKIVLPGGKLAYGSLAQNPRGESSSPEDYWTVSAIKGHSFYKVLSSSSPVGSTVNLDDPSSLQSLALAQDLTRGVILDTIFRQVDRLGNISTAKLQHYVTKDGKVKSDKNVSDKDKADAVSPLQSLVRIVYKDNDDGMMWGRTSISVSPIMDETRHLDKTVYSRLQWLSGLMQDSEPGSGIKVKDYFVNAVHISGANYDAMKASVVKLAAALKAKVDSGAIRLDLDFEGTMKKLYANAVEPTPAPTPQPVPVHGDSHTGLPVGLETTNHTSPNGTVEVAIRPGNFPSHPEIYSKKDLEKEKELAEFDFYNGKTKDGLDIVAIPKTYSTSPGLNIHAVKLPTGMSRLGYASSHTGKTNADGGKVVAKFKQTMPTHFTYSPSILGYYHLSRFLDAGHVEPTIIRTMDVQAHKPLADLGKAKSVGSNNRQQWTELRALDDSHSNPSLYTKDGKQLYGALQGNPGGEQQYPHLSDLAGVNAFAASGEFGKVTDPNSLKLTYKDASGKLNQSAIQQLVQVKDLANMVLMDFIMSQADRFSGNMHSEKEYVWIENGIVKQTTKKSNPTKAAEQLKQIPPDAVQINRMIMKDNDAGLISGNSAKAGHLLERLSHISPKTYNRLLDLQKELQKPEVAQWYQTDLLFTPANFKTVKDNVDQAVSILTSRKDRNLFLDASLGAALGLEDNQQPEPGDKPDVPIVDGPTAPAITSSVGRWDKGAVNSRADVETVQRLLTAAAQKLSAPQIEPQGIDGKIARLPAKSNTAAAIEAFQSFFHIAVDGVIQPNSPTWQALQKAAGEVPR